MSNVTDGLSLRYFGTVKPANRELICRLVLAGESRRGLQHHVNRQKNLVAENEGNLYPLHMDISLTNLEEALSIRRQINTLENRLSSLLGTTPSPSASKLGPRRMSPRARAKIAAAMRARWAKRKRTSPGKPAVKKGGLTPAGRKRLSQLMKARWAARKRAGNK